MNWGLIRPITMRSLSPDWVAKISVYYDYYEKGLVLQWNIRTLSQDIFFFIIFVIQYLRNQLFSSEYEI